MLTTKWKNSQKNKIMDPLNSNAELHLVIKDGRLRGKCKGDMVALAWGLSRMYDDSEQFKQMVIGSVIGHDEMMAVKQRVLRRASKPTAKKTAVAKGKTDKRRKKA